MMQVEQVNEIHEDQIVTKTEITFAMRWWNYFRRENNSSEDHITRWSVCLHAESSQKVACTSSQRESSL